MFETLRFAVLVSEPPSSHNVRDRVLYEMGHRISYKIARVRSGPLLSANRIVGLYRMYQWRANARIRLCTCVR